MSKFRTPKNKRTTYIYRDANGNKILELKPGENGITQADIAMLHRADDDEWDNNYKQVMGHKTNPNGTVSIDAVDPDGVWICSINADPLERIVAEETDRKIKNSVHEAIEKLPVKQANAVHAVYFRKITASDYANELGIPEVDVSNLLSCALKNLSNLINL